MTVATQELKPKSVPQIKPAESDLTVESVNDPSFSKNGWSSFVGFFLVLFAFGQLIAYWAYAQSHYAAWIAGLVFSVAGITVALSCLFSRLSTQASTIRMLQTNSRVKEESAVVPSTLATTFSKSSNLLEQRKASA